MWRRKAQRSNKQRRVDIYRYVCRKREIKANVPRNVKHTNSRPLVLSKLLWKVGINSALPRRLLLDVKINSTRVPSSHPLQQLIDLNALCVTSIQRFHCQRMRERESLRVTLPVGRVDTANSHNCLIHRRDSKYIIQVVYKTDRVNLCITYPVLGLETSSFHHLKE